MLQYRLVLGRWKHVRLPKQEDCIDYLKDRCGDTEESQGKSVRPGPRPEVRPQIRSKYQIPSSRSDRLTFKPSAMTSSMCSEMDLRPRSTSEMKLLSMPKSTAIRSCVIFRARRSSRRRRPNRELISRGKRSVDAFVLMFGKDLVTALVVPSLLVLG
jgi:hypothetical protein